MTGTASVAGDPRSVDEADGRGGCRGLPERPERAEPPQGLPEDPEDEVRRPELWGRSVLSATPLSAGVARIASEPKAAAAPAVSPRSKPRVNE